MTATATLDGDPLLAERLVANLLTNAVRHNVAGGRVEVTTGVTGGMAVLTVTNTGPLIPPADVDRLFQPFQRLDRRRANYPDGHGLGLSIVRAIATAHDATIAAHARPDGGLSVSVIFPPPASPAAHLPGPSITPAARLPGLDADGSQRIHGLSHGFAARLRYPSAHLADTRPDGLQAAQHRRQIRGVVVPEPGVRGGLLQPPASSWSS